MAWKPFKGTVAGCAVFVFVVSGAGTAEEVDPNDRWWEPASHRSNARHSIHVRADIDGRSQLVVRGAQVHWYHLEFAAPGRESGLTLPTYINGKTWYPEWPRRGRNDFGRCNSSKYDDLEPALPAEPVTVRVVTHLARGPVTVVQQPTAVNGYTLIADFNDRSQGGSDWYEVTLEWKGPSGGWGDERASDLIVLDVRILDLAPPASAGGSRNPAQDAEPFPADVTAGTTSVLARGMPSLRHFLGDLKKRSKIDVRLNRRVFARPEELVRIELGHSEPGQPALLMVGKATVLNRNGPAVELRMYFERTNGDAAERTGHPGPRGRRPPEPAIAFDWACRLQNGETALTILRPADPNARSPLTLAAVTTRLMAFME